MVTTTVLQGFPFHARSVTRARLRRSLGLPIVAMLFSMPALAASPAGADAPLLTHPDASWSLRLDLPGFEIKPPRVLRDRSQAWALASSRQTGVSLTVLVEKATRLRKTSECRDQAFKRLAESRKRLSQSEHGDWALAEVAPAEGAAGQAEPGLLHAYLYHDNFCVEARLSKSPYRPEDRGLLLKTLEGLGAVPASREEMARAAAYTPLSGPGEQIALEAAQRLRARDFSAAEGLLLPVCPEAGRQAGDAAGSPECALRTAAGAEARALRQGQDLAGMYWRAGDLLARDDRPDAALEVFRKSLDLRPDGADTLYSIGHAQRSRNDLAAAGAAFTRALELRPNDARTMYALATNLMDQGKLVEADAMLDRIERAYPKEIRVWFCRGEIQMRRGRYTQAIAYFEKAEDLGFDAEKTKAKIKECKAALAPRRQ